MPEGLDTSASVHIYKPKLWIFLVSIFSLIFFGIVIGLPLLLLLTMSISMLQSESEISPISVGFLCFLAPLIILMSLVLIQQLVILIAQFFSFIKISSAGLEQKIWPYKHIRCDWSDVDRIGKWWLFTDVVYLKTCEIIGPSISLKMPFRLFRFSSQDFIALSSYRGWSDGQLAEDIRQYAPQLFNEIDTQDSVLGKRLSTQQVVSDSERSLLHPSGLSQEERLLAALSHGSVLFSYVGIIVPAVIWATQKSKSTYMGFQALQALIWQATMLVFNLMIAACIMCAAFAPIFMMPVIERETTGTVAFGGMFLGIMAVSILLMFGSFAFVAYGIIGAVMTYQGKNFRYAIIANRLEKRVGGSTQQSSA